MRHQVDKRPRLAQQPGNEACGYMSQGIDCYDTYAAVGHPDNPLIISDGTHGAPTYNADGVHVNEAGAIKVAADMDALIEMIRKRPLP